MEPSPSGSGSGSGSGSAPYALTPMTYAGEDILFCIDVGPESAVEMKPPTDGGPTCQRLGAIKQAILLFVQSKLDIHSDHRFAYTALTDSAAWIKKEFSCDVNDAREMAQMLKVDPTCNRADLTQLFKAAVIEARKSHSQGRTLRVILFYCRSSMLPEFERIPKLQKEFTLDVMYLHDNPVAEKNCPQKVLDALKEAMEYVNLYEGYIYESGEGLTDILFRDTCLLLAHAQQRCKQDANDVPKSLTGKLPTTDFDGEGEVVNIRPSKHRAGKAKRKK